MSGHGKKHKKHKRPAQRLVCAQCLTVSDGSSAALLTSVAAALNACGQAGLRVRLRHGIVITPGGYVLPLKHGRWTARTLAYDPLTTGTPAGEDDDDD